MSEKVTMRAFRDFKSYMRKMIRDIAGAKTGGYHNNQAMQELAIVWNAGDKPKLEGYPMPENLTHIAHEPHINQLEMGEYVFKRVIQKLMVQAGFEEGDDMFISQIRRGQFECTMYSSYKDMGEDAEMAATIDCFFIRANGALDRAKDFFKNLDDATLDKTCRDVLKEYRLEIDEKPRRRKRPLVPGLKP